ncbi:MAG: TetR/AcrR family transcriptional regulator [Anaerolineae bacterium]|nr:TetR/AcrR family transcriptional regulator [Anaerolineae bacterium]
MTNWQGELREKRREVILKAAAVIFAHKGYQRATMKDIAEEAGIAPGTIYLYFKNKHTLLVNIFEQLTRLMPQELPLNSTPDEERSFIHDVMDEQLRMIVEYRPFFRAVAAEIWTDHALWLQFWNQVFSPILNTIELFLRIGMDTGRTREFDARIVAQAMVGAVYLFAVTSDLPPEDYLSDSHREGLVKELTDFFLYGIRRPLPEA